MEIRDEFGHGEIDIVVGSKKENESCALTIVERKTGNDIWVKLESHHRKWHKA